MDDRVINILLVEDDEVDVMTVKRAFTRANITNPLLVAANGIEALEILRKEELPPTRRLILLDVNMPKMSGWETLRVLKAEPSLAPVPVVMFTIKSEVRDKVHGLQDGAHDYITKPFQVDEMAARVRRIFQGVGA